MGKRRLVTWQTGPKNGAISFWWMRVEVHMCSTSGTSPLLLTSFNFIKLISGHSHLNKSALDPFLDDVDHYKTQIKGESSRMEIFCTIPY